MRSYYQPVTALPAVTAVSYRPPYRYRQKVQMSLPWTATLKEYCEGYHNNGGIRVGVRHLPKWLPTSLDICRVFENIVGHYAGRRKIFFPYTTKL
jgi:hypothetical protein